MVLTESCGAANRPTAATTSETQIQNVNRGFDFMYTFPLTARIREVCPIAAAFPCASTTQPENDKCLLIRAWQLNAQGSSLQRCFGSCRIDSKGQFDNLHDFLIRAASILEAAGIAMHSADDCLLVAEHDF